MQATAADFICYTVSDLDTAVDFFHERLGLAVEYHNEETGWAELACPPTTLALGQATPHSPLSPGAGGVTLALAVDDIESAVEDLRAQDVTITMDPVDTNVCDIAMIEDPDGNPIILHHRHDGTVGRRDPFE